MPCSVICTNCPEKEVNISNENNKVNINANGIDINSTKMAKSAVLKLIKTEIDNQTIARHE